MAKKKKVRVELRKNRQKRARIKDLTRQFQRDELGRVEPGSAERVRA